MTFLRAVLAFIACPGMVALAVPLIWLYVQNRGLLHPSALVLVLAGLLLLLACVRAFYVAGKGTLAPWAPPRNLVVTGPYRYSRNPMYVAVSAMLLGWASAFVVPGLFLYAAIVMLAFTLRVRYGEEPWLARHHGVQWEQYRSRVPRWF